MQSSGSLFLPGTMYFNGSICCPPVVFSIQSATFGINDTKIAKVLVERCIAADFSSFPPRLFHLEELSGARRSYRELKADTLVDI